MNSKLINDLAEHADFYVGNEHYDKSYEDRQRIFLEKFAELVILECAEIARLNTRVDSKVYLMIQEHFALEG